MNRLQHIIAKYKTAAFLILDIFVCGIYSILLMQLKSPIWVLFIVNLVLTFIVYAYVEYSPTVIMQKSLKELNENCNPYPLYEETAKLLTYKNSVIVQQMILMNHAVALRSIGEYKRNLDALRTLNIDKAPGMPNENKVAYYNNLMDAYGMLERYEEADLWYSKMMLIYADITNQKQLKMLEFAVQSAKAFHHFCEKDYEKALLMLKEAKPKNRRDEVDNAMLYARAAIAMGNMEAAKEKLRFVIDNGNRLHIVTEAEKLLAGE